MFRILLAAAVIPAAVLMKLVYDADKIEKEPKNLLTKLVLFGVLSCIPAALLESVFLPVVEGLADYSSVRTVLFLENFFVVALAEEGCKLFFLYKGSWKNPAFNYRFDGIVYSVFLGLGFAALENVKYVFAYGLGVAFSRALMSVPGHCTFAVFMGFYYAGAKLAAVNGDSGKKRSQMRLALIVPLLLHGYFDYILSVSNGGLSVTFLLFVVILDIVSIRLVKSQSRKDMPLYAPRDRTDENG